jgi:hypothetical protein
VVRSVTSGYWRDVGYRLVVDVIGWEPACISTVLAHLSKESCGKHGYATEKAAKRKMKEIRKRRSSTTRRKFGKFETRVYKCQVCSQFHLTSHEFEE